MPKQRITRKMVLDAAMRILRRSGRSAVTVRNIAEELGCSVQPVYSTFSSMDGLWSAMEEEAVRIVHGMIPRDLDRSNLFRSTGKAYVSIARDEPHLFALFAGAHRCGIHCLADLISTESDPRITGVLERTLGIREQEARDLQLNMIIYTLGLCTILASCAPDLDPEEVFQRMDGAFEAFSAASTREDDGK